MPKRRPRRSEQPEDASEDFRWERFTVTPGSGEIIVSPISQRGVPPTKPQDPDDSPPTEA